MKYLTFLCSLLLFFGCGSDDPGTPMDAPEPTVTDFTIQTSDGVDIFTKILKPDNLNGQAPAVIFIHGNTSDGSTEWTENDLFQQVLEEGYIVVAYDIRTYGNSGTDGEPQGTLLTDADRAPLDLDAVIAFLKEDDDIDPDRIGAIGSKLGAEVALVGLVKEDLKTVIGFSIIRAGYTSLSVNVANPQLRSVFYIASELDFGGVTVSDAQVLLEDTQAPRKLHIVEGSDASGSDILMDDATLSGPIITWLSENLL